MNMNSCIRGLCIAAWCPLLVILGGCSHLYYVQGYSESPVVEAGKTATVQRWSSDSLHIGWDIQGWIDKNCDLKMTASCDSAGNWTITNKINNRNDSRIFRTEMAFGHADNQNFQTFSALVVRSTGDTQVKKNDQQISAGSGSCDPAIAKNFSQINAVRPILIMQDGTIWPISFQSATQLDCTPVGSVQHPG